MCSVINPQDFKDSAIPLPHELSIVFDDLIGDIKSSSQDDIAFLQEIKEKYKTDMRYRKHYLAINLFISRIEDYNKLLVIDLQYFKDSLKP